MLATLLKDRKYKIPRMWSNRELRRVAPLFTGDVLNVSGWRDQDKEGGHYRDYFTNAGRYMISNYKEEARGMQGFDNEFFLDLADDLEEAQVGRFDVVFNHTTLEHIYDVRKAFRNLCLLSRDIVIIVVPFLQQMHADYGDYWRFTPLAVKQLFEENGVGLLSLTYNSHRHTSVYIFAIGSKKPEAWNNLIRTEFTFTCKKAFLDTGEPFIGCRAITNSLVYRLKRALGI